METVAPAKAETTIPARLRSAGLRPTRQRLAIAGLLFKDPDKHVSAESLHGDVLAAGEKMSLATIYNNLHQFAAAGLLREVIVEAGKSLFDTRTDDHAHMRRMDTGEFIDCAMPDCSHPPPPEGTKVHRIDITIHLIPRPA